LSDFLIALRCDTSGSLRAEQHAVATRIRARERSGCGESCALFTNCVFFVSSDLFDACSLSSLAPRPLSATGHELSVLVRRLIRKELKALKTAADARTVATRLFSKKQRCTKPVSCTVPIFEDQNCAADFSFGCLFVHYSDSLVSALFHSRPRLKAEKPNLGLKHGRFQCVDSVSE
jgi:hypothetical protein